MNINLVERPPETMGGVYAFADFEDLSSVGQRRPVIAFSRQLVEWSDKAVQYAAAHEFAHHYLRHPLWLKRLGRNSAPLLRSYFEQQAIEWAEQIWGFGSEKQAAMQEKGMGAL